jgi:hypothetical protein
MTTTTPTTFRAFVREPFDLALGQPHQILISSASVAIVALEAGTIVPWPANIALAIGAEWAYLRGLISGSGVKTPWAAALNWSAVLLVVLYGTLAGLRSFQLIPATPPWGVAVLLTLIHIGAISAVTLCSAMLHRAGEDAKAAQLQITVDRETQRQVERHAYEAELQKRRDDQQLELEAEWKRTQLQIEAERQQAQIDAERERTRAELRARVRAQRLPSAAGTAANSAPNTRANSDREQLRRTVAERLREQPRTNRSALARSLGIGRTTLYELIEEARANGDLTAAE